MQCVMCGRYTPEGRQACKRCEGGDKIDDRDTRQKWIKTHFKQTMQQELRRV